MNELLHKAAILQEALPYIRRFHGSTVVVKYGGHAMVDETLKESFAKDVCLLRYVGIRIVVVHGGGPQINHVLDRMGIQAKFADGLRITDDETMDIVEMVLCGSVNSSIVSMICKHGGRAVGVSGKDDRCLYARRVSEVQQGEDEQGRSRVDLGRVGQIEHVNARLIQELIDNNVIPVIAPIASDADGNALNVNADIAAGNLASALGAAKLLLMTDVEGVKTKAGELIPSLRARDVENLIAEGVITGGMIPKVRCALQAVNDHVEKAHIIDGRVQHALLLEILTDRGVGTEIQRLRDP
ncbi:MAG TPA: acetylglutamate kinase [Polyangiaceae bacterium]|nr:acetylglutamate kinase [Polyangiaceae bacterium]